ncbi:aspartyl protease family protein [Roseateles chitinivorans]|uniref:aspartyl protease family protein n=1 Tax=Roseateles chitinivorans TaxID=2917965 RepID=UPI003D67FA29
MNARRLAPLLAMILMATGAAAEETPDKAPEKVLDKNRCVIEAMTIPVRLVESRPVATLQLNGVAVPMLVDSGAFYSFLSASTAQQLALPLRRPPGNLKVYGVTGPVEGLRVTTVQRVALEGATLEHVEFIVGGSELGAGIMGVLGRNFLSIADTEYDLAHGVVRLVSPQGECKDRSLAYWAGDAPVIEAPLLRYGRNDRAVRVEVQVNGRKLEALMDTGAPQTSLTLSAARKAGIAEADMTPGGRSGGAGADLAQYWVANVERFELGGEKVRDNRMKVSDVSGRDQDMLLGLDYFLAHRVYVSRLQGKVYATWNGGKVFAPSRPASAVYNASYAAKAEEIAADDADGLARRGNASLVAGDAARALEDLDRAIRLAPTVAGYFDSRARVQIALKRPKAALADLDEALRLDPALAEARLRRVSLRFAAKDTDGAAADLGELDATLPPASNLRATMATTYARRGQVPEALRQFELWIGSHPKDLRLAAMLGERCWMRTRLNLEAEKAVDDCKAAIDRDEDEPAYHWQLGWAWLRQGDATRARKAFDQAITRKPSAWAHYGRAVALFKLNETDKARQELEAARKLTPAIDESVKKAGFDALVVAPAGSTSAPASAASL